jgi:hypothetical protein
MSEDDDILAVVAALEFLSSRDEAPAPRSMWNEAARLFEDDDRERTWKNS